MIFVSTRSMRRRSTHKARFTRPRPRLTQTRQTGSSPPSSGPLAATCLPRGVDRRPPSGGRTSCMAMVIRTSAAFIQSDDERGPMGDGEIAPERQSVHGERQPSQSRPGEAATRPFFRRREAGVRAIGPRFAIPFRPTCRMPLLRSWLEALRHGNGGSSNAACYRQPTSSRPPEPMLPMTRTACRRRASAPPVGSGASWPGTGGYRRRAVRPTPI